MSGLFGTSSSTANSQELPYSNTLLTLVDKLVERYRSLGLDALTLDWDSEYATPKVSRLHSRFK